ncbi:MAG: hypothetical protein ACKVWR_16055 [Acidimicrobiales bacterium]
MLDELVLQTLAKDRRRALLADAEAARLRRTARHARRAAHAARCPAHGLVEALPELRGPLSGRFSLLAGWWERLRAW